MIDWLAEPMLFGYIGPGAGLSMMGTLLAVVGVLLLALLAPAIYVFQLLWSLVRRRFASAAKSVRAS